MRFVVYEDSAGQYRWRLIARNSRIVADSSEGYTRRLNAHNAAVKVATELRNDFLARGTYTVENA